MVATKYQNITKAQSRGWIWNQIDARLPKPKWERQNCRAYVLIGDTLEELKAGLKRGFSPFNLIGVDKDKKKVEMWREAGGLAIQGPLDLVVANSKVKPHVVICDFCGGMTGDNFHTFWTCFMGVNYHGAVALNMLRGRDDIESFRKELNTARICDALGLNCKNRGHLMYVKMLVDSFFFEPTIMQMYENNVDGFTMFAQAITRHLNPKFNWYRSADSRQYFDTMILSMPNSKQFSDPHALDDLASERQRIRMQSEECKVVKRRLAALEAVRTMAIQKNRGRMFKRMDI